MARMARHPQRFQHVGVRFTVGEKRLIEAAAEWTGRESLSEYVRETLVQKAQEDLSGPREPGNPQPER